MFIHIILQINNTFTSEIKMYSVSYVFCILRESPHDPMRSSNIRPAEYIDGYKKSTVWQMLLGVSSQ